MKHFLLGHVLLFSSWLLVNCPFRSHFGLVLIISILMVCVFYVSMFLILQSEKACLGDILHRYITADQFSPEYFLDYLDLSSEYTTLDIANRIESAVHFWRLKSQKKKLNRAKTGSWSGTVKGLGGDIEKSKLFANRADTLLKNLKLYFPGLPQTALDMNKIQFNKV